MPKSLAAVLATLSLVLLTAGCGDSVLDPKFHPEIANTANVAFSFQATGLASVTDDLSYTWNVSSGRVILHPSTATSSGSFVLTIKDAGGATIYSGPVPPSGDITPAAGAGGAWTIRLTLSKFTGTINFAVQMIP